MRIRKEISNWNSKMFILIAFVVFIIFNAIILLLNYLGGKDVLAFSYSWILSGFIQPLLLAAIFTNASKKMTLVINDFQAIDSFKDKLNTSILNKGVEVQESADSNIRYAATGWFYKLFNYWDGFETVTVKWGNEVVIEGSSRLVSQV